MTPRTRLTLLVGASLALALATLLPLDRGQPTSVEPSADGPASSEAAPPELDLRALPRRAAAPLSFDQAITAHRDLYGEQGMLTLEETRRLKAARALAKERVKATIADADVDQLVAIGAAWRSAEKSRDKLVIIGGLAGNDLPEAVGLLEDIYAEAEMFRMREETLRALGNSEADGRNALLLDELFLAEDERLAQLAAQALYGEAAAVGSLAEAVYSELPINARLEAIHSMGAARTDEALEALRGISGDASLEARVRSYATKEIERSFS